MHQPKEFISKKVKRALSWQFTCIKVLRFERKCVFLKEGKGSRAPYHDFEIVVTINHHHQSTQSEKVIKVQKEKLLRNCVAFLL
jgi:hypothetical protein